MLSQYTMSNSKKHKMQIIQLVVQNIIEGGGRFLKKENRNKLWYDGGVLCGKDKVSIIHQWKTCTFFGCQFDWNGVRTVLFL